MRSIRLENVTKFFDGEPIIENLNLTIEGGKFFALLGPSGSGKTTLLRLIAGFEQPDSGSIYLGEQDITHLPINERRINTVFQHYALFPHLNVFDNVAYGLHIRGIAQPVVQEKVIKILRRMRLEKQIYKPIGQLSGGQQQRVALARAIINEPAVLLLDEPLAALDLKLREQMLIELIDLQYDLNTTFVYVTHDQFEALTVADYMAIMNPHGEIAQIDAPRKVYEFPRTTFVAKFIGNTNLFKGMLQIKDERSTIAIEHLGDCIVSKPDLPWARDGAHIYMSLRPEKIYLSKKVLQGFDNHIEGTVETIVYHGRSTQYNIRVHEDLKMQVFEQNEEHFEKEVVDYDDRVHLYWHKRDVVLLEK